MGWEFEHSSDMRNELIENSSCINDLIETHLYPTFHIIHMYMDVLHVPGRHSNAYKHSYSYTHTHHPSSHQNLCTIL